MIKKTTITGLCVLLVFTLLGCGGSSPDKVVGNYLTAMQQGDFETAAQYLEPTKEESNFTDDLSNSDPDDKKMQKAFFSKIKYEIISSTVEEDTAKVKTKITSLDLIKITSTVMAEIIPLAFASGFSENSNEEEVYKLSEQYFNNAVLDPEAPTVTNTVIITLNKQDGSWKIVPDGELMKGILGNIGILADMFRSEIEK